MLSHVTRLLLADRKNCRSIAGIWTWRPGSRAAGGARLRGRRGRPAPPARRKITRRNRRRAGWPAPAGECAQRTVAAGRAQGDRPAAAAPMIAQAPRRARCGAPPAAPGRPPRGARRPAPAARAAALRPGRRGPADRTGPPCPRHPRRPAPGIPVNRLNCHQNIPEYACYLRTNFPAVRNPVLTLRDDRGHRGRGPPRPPLPWATPPVTSDPGGPAPRATPPGHPGPGPAASPPRSEPPGPTAPASAPAPVRRPGSM